MLKLIIIIVMIIIILLIIIPFWLSKVTGCPTRAKLIVC